VTVAAWLSVYAESWDCQACLSGKRRSAYICPNRGGSIDTAVQRLSKIKKEDCPSVIARYDYSGVCPYMFITQIVREFMASRRWFDSGNVGFSFLQAPTWYTEALALYDMESSRAMRCKQKEKS
jgi:hypothetical protein